jgi:hypothetical protein
VLRKFMRESICGRSRRVTRQTILMPRAQTWEVPTHRAWRHGQSQFEDEFIRDPFFTPGRVRLGHAHDESLQLPRNGRSSWSRLPPPEEPPALTMPPDERVWLDHREERAPVQQA